MSSETYQVAGYEVVPALRLIRGPQAQWRLEPKVMSVLQVLVEQAGQVVDKSHFMSRVWPDTCVGDDSLVRCIGQLRKIFRDTDRNDRIIETVAKKGYRLLAPIQDRAPRQQTLEATLHAVLESCSDQIYVVDRDRRYVFVSRAASSALGFRSSEMIGKTWRELGMSASVMEPFERLLADVIAGKGFIRDTVRFPAILGTRELEYVLNPIMADGELVAVITLVRDVTENWFKERAV